MGVRMFKDTLRYKAQRIAEAGGTGKVPTPMASPPTLAVSAHNAATTIPGGVTLRADQNQQLFCFLGSVPRARTISGGNQWSGYTSIDLYYAGGVRRAGGAYRGGALRVRFGYGGRLLDVLLLRSSNNAATGGYRLWVDGQPTQVAPRTDLDGTSKSMRLIVDFGAAGDRIIEVELDQAVEFGGVTREPNYDVWRAHAPGPRILAHGDSFVDGTGADAMMQNCFAQATRRLGIGDAWAQGEGGLGYLAPGNSSGLNATAKLEDEVIAHNPDWVVVALGINDQGASASALQAAAAAYFDQLLTGLPFAGVTVIGPWRAPGLNPISGVGAAIANAVGSHASAVAAKRLMHFDTFAENWQQIAGRVGAPSGIGNSNVYIGADNIHPNQAGHDYLSGRIANAVQRHVGAILAG